MAQLYKSKVEVKVASMDRESIKKTEKKNFMKEVKRQKFLIFWSIIFVIYGVIFYYIPLAGWAIGFQDYKPKQQVNILKIITQGQYVGTKHFKYLFTSERFLKSVRNTFAMGSLKLLFTTVTAIAFAILLNEVRNLMAKKVVQTISYLPHFLSMVIVCGIFHDAFSSKGIINEVLTNTHILKSSFAFWGAPKWFWGLIVFLNVWKETGWNAIIYLAAITSIDPNLYEAAAIDGAGRWGKIRHITLPSIRPTIIILLIINIGNIINAGFEEQYMLRNGLVAQVSDTIDVYIFVDCMKGFAYSRGVAAGIFKSLIAIALIVIANTVAKKLGEERIF